MFKQRMKSASLLLCFALIGATSNVAKAVPIVEGDLGVNPTSASSAPILNRSVGAGSFDDAWTFTLSGSTFFSTSASATNTFSDPTAFISGFNIQIVSFGADGIFGTADDSVLVGPNAASSCGSTCQILSASGILNAGKYYVELQGTGDVNSGYAGNVDTRPVPGPLVGAGLPGLVCACGGLLTLARRRRNVVISA